MKKLYLLIACLFSSSFAYADAEVETAYRQAVMKSVGGHMTAIGTILRNQVYMEDLVFHADSLASLSDVAPKIFPPGSADEKSKALPAVWEDPDGFSAAMDAFVKAAGDFSAAAKSGDMAQIGPGVQTLGGSCKGCHDDYKEE